MFSYLNGTTVAGAADEVAAWFAAFELWITASVGWTVEAGSGTTDLILKSLGEGTALTMLYCRVWQDPGALDTVKIEMRNDLAGTQVTTEGGFLDSGGVQFEYFMSGDMDAFTICWKLGGGYKMIYAGLVMPFARTIPDETYQMIVTDDRWDVGGGCSILRDAAGLWDQDKALEDDSNMDGSLKDTKDGSLTLSGLCVDSGVNIAGQLKNVSAPINEPAITAENTVTTGQPGATSTWIVLEDSAGQRIAIRTGGVLPTGFAPGATFASTTGVAANYAALYAALDAHLTAIGWVALGDPGWGYDDGRLYYSAGESGTENIYAGLMRRLAGVDELYAIVTDDVIPTHLADILGTLDAVEFPVNYWISGDRDEFVLVVSRAGTYAFWYMGMGYVFAPGLPNTTYKVIASRASGGVGEILRQHDDAAWGAQVLNRFGVFAANSNPNAFDGVTYLVWPMVFYQAVVLDLIPMAQAKYWGYTDGGGVANLDTITIGTEVWTVFFVGAQSFCLRTT